MPSYIVKAKPDEDFYVEWSTIVDAPCAWGTRAELAQHLDYRENDPARWERADERGTSANWPNWPTNDMPFGWSDDEFVLMEAGPEDPEGQEGEGYWSVPRANLREFCERLGRSEDTADLCTWHTFEDAP